MKVARPAYPRLSIPSVPLANVVLLLTLVLPLAGASDGDRGSLPVSRHRIPADAGAAWIVIASDRAVLAERARFRFSHGVGPSRDFSEIESLVDEASKVARGDPPRAIVIRADAGSRYGAVDDLVDRLRRAGAATVLLETREEEP